LHIGNQPRKLAAGPRARPSRSDLLCSRPAAPTCGPVSAPGLLHARDGLLAAAVLQFAWTPGTHATSPQTWKTRRPNSTDGGLEERLQRGGKRTMVDPRILCKHTYPVLARTKGSDPGRSSRGFRVICRPSACWTDPPTPRKEPNPTDGQRRRARGRPPAPRAASAGRGAPPSTRAACCAGTSSPSRWAASSSA
jgi:hypothetical protein